MRVEQAVPVPGFARHETFHLRYGWLKKCHDAVARDARIFQREDALVRLGVGKNMVRAIRFWGIATKVIRQAVAPEAGRRGGQEVEVTEFGRSVFDDRRGWDPYLEKLETLWVLHWNLYSPPSAVPAWWILVNDLGAARVGSEDLPRHVLGRVSMVSDWPIPNESSIKKDTDAFVHTYASRHGGAGDAEDYTDCPLRALRLLRAGAAEGSGLQFAVGPKPGLSPRVAEHVCLDFVARRGGGGARTVTVGSLASEQGGPGHALKLDEAGLGALLSEASALRGSEIAVQDTGGVAQVALPADAAGAAARALGRVYGAGRRAAAPRAVAVARATAGGRR